MTAAVHQMSTPSLTVPPSQNTAPVLEFNCLYTHDVRRKQKRWQDGFLRFHTFNKRVMVYDVPRNLIGDMHWAAEELVQEGDEMTLDKDGVMVQVAESVGRTETDLTELRQSAKNQSRQAGKGRSSPARPSMATPSRAMPPLIARSTAAGSGTQLKHRSLNALLGTPKGPIGKAMLPAKSPFEMRQQDVENAGWEEGRPPKRQRTEPWNVVRTTTTPKPKPTSKETPLWARIADAKASAKKAKKKAVLPVGQQRLGTREIIDLSEDGDDAPAGFLPGFSSDAVVPPSSPPKERPRAAAERAMRSSPPAARSEQSGKRRTTESTAAVSTKVSEAKSPRRQIRVQRSPSPVRQRNVSAPVAPPFLPPPSAKPGQTLRFTSSAPKKKTLACLDQLSKPSQASARVGEQDVNADGKPGRKTQRELLEERLQRAKRSVQQQQEDLDAVIADAEATGDSMCPTDAQPDTTELNRLDHMLLPRTSTEPEPLPKPPDTKSAPMRVRAFERVVSESDARASAQPKRPPGAPVRFTPSPTRRAALNEQRSRRGSTTSVQSLPEAEPSPSKASKKPSPEPMPAKAKSPPTRKPSPRPPSVEPASAEPPKQPVENMPPPAKPTRRKAGIGRKEIRKSAQACFPTAINTAAPNGTSVVMLKKPFNAPKPPAQPKAPPTSKEAGPWSREAFDLFAWRPPNWDEEEWCVKGDPVAGNAEA